MVSKGDSLRGWGDVLRLWDGNPIKLNCDDHCTTINVINSLSNKIFLIDSSHLHLTIEYAKKEKKSLINFEFRLIHQT